MNKIAEVHFAYSPKNDDELELTVGDIIEVIGVEEEGWWKGKLKGRIGVFPSNFVVVNPASTGAASSAIQQQHSATSNKLNTIFGSKLGSKSSLSSNSLNTINSTSNNSLNNNFTPANNNLSNMSNTTNNTQSEALGADPQHNKNEGYDESNNNSSSERRPKPIRGIGYGDIFAAGAKTKQTLTPTDATRANAGSGVVASERLNNSLAGNTLQKPIPKKPPPPTPAGTANDQSGGAQNGSINSTTDQAPALPPKPCNQSFSPFMQQTRLLSQQQQQSQQIVGSPSQVVGIREQARVIHAYEPKNDDELELKVNDIINIIDKKSEDHGWWKGELNGKIGVFPDNFVQLIAMPDIPMTSQTISSPMANGQSEWLSNRSSGAASSSVFSPPQQQQIGSTESRVKSVFSSTPKGFSKELESNLEKNNSNPASFLSLKRNKLIGQFTANSTGPIATNTTQMNMGFVSSAVWNDTATSSNGHSSTSPLEADSPTKLNHITANRSKGPSRRPPSHVLNRRPHAASDGSYGVIKKEASSSNDSSREEQPSMVSQEAQILTTLPNKQQDTQASLSSEPIHQQPQEHKQSSVANTNGPVSSSPFTVNSIASKISATNSNDNAATPTSSLRPNSNNTVDINQQIVQAASSMMAAPKTSLRLGQQTTSEDAISKNGQKTPTSITDSPPTSTPPWMVNLRKTNAEKKREPSLPTTTALTSSPATAVPISTTTTQSTLTPVTPNLVGPKCDSFSAPVQVASPPKVSQPVDNGTNEHITTNSQAIKTSIAAGVVSIAQLNESLAKYDNLYKQISENVTSGLNELWKDVKQIQEDLKGINDLKSAIESMKIELRTCQSATENQRKYIKELVNNLADERKKIAAMQDELDRNLK